MKLIRLINKILLRKMRKTRIWSALKAIKMSIFYRINRRYKVPDMSGIRRGDSLVKIRGLVCQVDLTRSWKDYETCCC